MIGTRSRVSLCALGVVIPLLLAQPVAAATVRCGDVSCLITMINQANAQPKQMTIRLVAGTYTLAEGLPTVTGTVAIDVPPGTVITRDASKLPEFRLLQVAATGRLTITGLTLQGGIPGIVNAGTLTVTDSIFIGGFVGGGSGAVINTGTLTLFRTAVVDSGGVFSSAVESSGGLVTIAQCLFSGDNGGLSWPALAINGGEAHISRTMFTKGNQDGPSSLSVSALASVAVYDSAFVNNFGGVLDNAGDLIITNTTFTGNRFTSFFGGSVISNTGRLTVRSSTFADNGFGSVFGGVFGLVVNIASSVAPAVTTVVNTILVHDGIVNTKDCVSELGGKITSLGHNLVTDATGCGQIPSDLIGDAGLGALVDNGIPGNAHLDLLSGSRAINAADSAACPKTDQIGQRRLPHCDIGAVEFKKSAQHNDADEHEHDSPGLWQDLD